MSLPASGSYMLSERALEKFVDRTADWIAHYKKQLAHTRENLEWLEERFLTIREVSDNGEVADLTKELIEHDKRTIATLEKVIWAMEAKDATRP